MQVKLLHFILSRYLSKAAEVSLSIDMETMDRNLRSYAQPQRNYTYYTRYETAKSDLLKKIETSGFSTSSPLERIGLDKINSTDFVGENIRDFILENSEIRSADTQSASFASYTEKLSSFLTAAQRVTDSLANVSFKSILDQENASDFAFIYIPDDDANGEFERVERVVKEWRQHFQIASECMSGEPNAFTLQDFERGSFILVVIAAAPILYTYLKVVNLVLDVRIKTLTIEKMKRELASTGVEGILESAQESIDEAKNLKLDEAAAALAEMGSANLSARTEPERKIQATTTVNFINRKLDEGVLIDVQIEGEGLSEQMQSDVANIYQQATKKWNDLVSKQEQLKLQSPLLVSGPTKAETTMPESDA